jgi:hypothetical protein
MRRLPTAVSIGTLLLVAGCAPVTPANMRENNWDVLRSSDISCLDKVHVAADYYDLNGDGHDEAFLTMRCTARSDPPGDQLEMVAGGTDTRTTHPTKLVLQMPPAVVDRICFSHGSAIYRVSIAGHSQTWQVSWLKGAATPGKPTPGPSQGCPLTTATDILS